MDNPMATLCRAAGVRPSALARRLGKTEEQISQALGQPGEQLSTFLAIAKLIGPAELRLPGAKLGFWIPRKPIEEKLTDSAWRKSVGLLPWPATTGELNRMVADLWDRTLPTAENMSHCAALIAQEMIGNFMPRARGGR